jgi:hypothetical protein
MINLNQQLCNELELVYWQLDGCDSTIEQAPQYSINREERELLRKILLAKGIMLTDEMLTIHDEGIAIVIVNNHQLIFDDVKANDKDNCTHLAKVSEMLNSVEHKKHTWFKLKNLELLL